MKKFCFLLLSLVLVLSCRQGMEFDSSPRSNIEALWDIIDRRYCFLPYKAETIGLDWNRVREKYTAQVSPDMNSAQLFEVMSNMLAELQDGHVNLYYSADMSRYWSWHEDYPRNFDEDLRPLSGQGLQDCRRTEVPHPRRQHRLCGLRKFLIGHRGRQH